MKQQLRCSEEHEAEARRRLEGTERMLYEYVGLFHWWQAEGSRMRQRLEELQGDCYIPPQWSISRTVDV